MKTWIFQGNPDVFDIDSYLAATAGLITWRVARYAEQIEPGDTVYIWRSQGDQPQMAGIVAEGTVVEPPRVHSLTIQFPVPSGRKHPGRMSLCGSGSG